MGRQCEDIAQLGEDGIVGDDAAEGGEGAVFGVDANRQRIFQRSLQLVQCHAARPVGIGRQEAVDRCRTEAGAIRAEEEDSKTIGSRRIGVT